MVGGMRLSKFRTEVNKVLKGTDVFHKIGYYESMLLVGLKDMWQEFECVDEKPKSKSTKTYFNARQIPLNNWDIIESWKNNGNCFNISAKKVVTDIYNQGRLNFNLNTALNTLELQPDSVEWVLRQIFNPRPKNEYYNIRGLCEPNFKIPKLYFDISGVSFPVLACDFPFGRLNVKKIGNSIFLMDGERVFDCYLVNNFMLYNESLNMRRNYFWRGGEEVNSAICWNFNEIRDFWLSNNKNDVLIRCLGENLVNNFWFMWGFHSHLVMRRKGMELMGRDLKPTGMFSASKGTCNLYELGSLRPIRTALRSECIFSSDDIVNIYELFK